MCIVGVSQAACLLLQKIVSRVEMRWLVRQFILHANGKGFVCILGGVLQPAQFNRTICIYCIYFVMSNKINKVQFKENIFLFAVTVLRYERK